MFRMVARDSSTAAATSSRSDFISTMSADSMATSSKAMNKTMKIEGMMCAHCTGRVEKALS